MHRFFVSKDLLEGGEIRLEGELAHQLSRVLRLVPGSQILLLDGEGYEAEAKLLNVPKSEAVTAQVGEKRKASGEPTLKITLYQALLKGEKFDWVLQKGTEVGICSFTPVVTERCISERERPERWQKIVREAAEQSRRGRLPQVHETVSLQKALKEMKESTLALVAWENEQHQTLKQVLNSVEKKPESLSLLIGPEGGLSETEVQAACADGISSVTLGARILRAETAGVIASALALYHFNE
ncbi:MAG: 16S rRNA (uracil(1498)-N(3))-methyltransferase [Chloroflexi bacterium]|uniref:Ribosomal RNA small subunit methyltransferase E n=1 Tax=Candidatus Chlorohelix allophototropha TaxID=3003348 RepID=A0A8T7LZC4_9CHLR|nr:16S rRNA (uracil(1498)-N(3))-methyltransferase [Chloroflexota bacterium]WJW66625.1 16S rRNA (uracil(1498)-N(3))-methyltransferase [Chloroflexota bacterium L227-S17]